MSRQILSKRCFSISKHVSARFQRSYDPAAVQKANEINQNMISALQQNIYETDQFHKEPTTQAIYQNRLENDLGDHKVWLDAKEAELYGWTDPSAASQPTQNVAGQAANNTGPYPNLVNPFLRTILYRASGYDIENILQKKTVRRQYSAKVRLMTTEQIMNRHDKVFKEAKTHYLSPPDYYEKPKIDEILSQDFEIEGHDSQEHIFVDISEKKLSKQEELFMTSLNTEDLHRDRFVTVRQPDGTLRLANWEERNRSLRVFYSDVREEFETSRKVFPVPPILVVNSEAFNQNLDQEWYVQLLDMGNIQYELDSSEWIALKNQVFKQVVNRYQIDRFYSKKYYINLIHWITQPLMNNLTKEEYLRACFLLLLGRNERNSTLANFEECRHMLSCLVLFNEQVFKANFSKILGDDLTGKLVAEIFASFNSALDKNLPSSQDENLTDRQILYQNFLKNANLARQGDSAQTFGTDEELFNSLDLISKNDQLFAEVIENIREFLKLDNLYLKADSSIKNSQNIREAIDHFGR